MMPQSRTRAAVFSGNEPVKSENWTFFFILLFPSADVTRDTFMQNFSPHAASCVWCSAVDERPAWPSLQRRSFRNCDWISPSVVFFWKHATHLCGCVCPQPNDSPCSCVCLWFCTCSFHFDRENYSKASLWMYVAFKTPNNTQSFNHWLTSAV